MKEGRGWRGEQERGEVIGEEGITEGRDKSSEEKNIRTLRPQNTNYKALSNI